MNINMTGFRWFSKSLHPCALDESSLSIGRVNNVHAQSDQKLSDNFDKIFRAKAGMWENY